MGKLEDLTGQRFGKLTVIRRAPNRKKHVYWECKCDCGNIKYARSDGLTNGSATSCEKCNFEDLTGKRFGRRVVIGRAPDRLSYDGYPIRYWTCKCDCGSINEVLEYQLTHGKSKSCGCLIRDIMREKQTKHNGTKTRLYGIWLNIKGRTRRVTDQAYKDYGGRGIDVCDEWYNSFECFRDWAYKNGYSDDLTIDRVNNDGNYEPSNCRWTTIEVQARNKRNTIRLTYDGKTFNAHDWSILCGVPERTIKSRVFDGWDAERILTTPFSPKLPQPVISISKDGFIREYESIADAARKNNVATPVINKICHGVGKTCKGMYFEFKNDVIGEGA